MRYFILCSLVLAITSSCTIVEYAPTKMRIDCQRKETPGDDSPQEQDRILYDSTLFYTALVFDQSYDWKLDTAFGKVSYDLVLYKDHEKILIIPSSSDCISSDCDTHHIIEGQLYTERTSSKETIVARNGVELFRFDGREKLKGLLPIEDKVYTLSQICSEAGYTLRCNGEFIEGDSKGYVIGDLSDTSYGQTGALYIDDGQMCYAYYTVDGYVKSYTISVDRKQDFLEVSDTYDIKRYRGDVIIAPQRSNSYKVEETRIHPYEDYFYVSGRFINNNTIFYGYAPERKFGYVKPIYTGESAELYIDGDNYMCIYRTGTGSKILVGDENLQFDAYKTMSARCAGVVGKSFYVGMSPNKAFERPFVLTPKDTSYIDINGYISSCTMQISKRE